MISKEMNRAEMIRWLGDAIRTETEKPFDEIDYDFVEECGCLLDELMGKTAVMTEEEARERLAKLIPAKDSVARKKPVKMRRMWKAIIAAAVVVCMGITVLAVPAIRMALMTALKLDVGDSIVENGITYIYSGKVKSYSNVDELLKNEDLDFSLPTIFSETLKLEKIVTVNEPQKIVLCFNTESITYTIWLNNTYIDPYIKNATEYQFNDHTAYVIPDETSGKKLFYSYTVVENDIHNIISDNLEDIELLIKSID